MDTDFTDHVGKEAFIRALHYGPLQLKVLEGEPTNLEQALALATKHEAYRSSLISQGTLSQSPTRTPPSDDDDRHKKRSRGVHAVKGKDKDATPQLSPSELRDLLAQATKGIAALAAQSGQTDKEEEFWMPRSRLLRRRILEQRALGRANLDGIRVEGRILR